MGLACQALLASVEGVVRVLALSRAPSQYKQTRSGGFMPSRASKMHALKSNKTSQWYTLGIALVI